MSLTKESTGTTTLPSTSRPKTAAGEKIEDASQPRPVCIEVPVTVQGVRPATDPGKREPFTESTRTVIVFANGAVVRLGAAVNSGQLLFLTNEHTKKEVVCQVVKSKTCQNVAGYIELEFTEPSPGFWGIRFPGERSEPQTEPKTPGVSQSSPKPQPAAPLPQDLPAAAARSHADVPPKLELPLPSAEHESPAALPLAFASPAKPATPLHPEPAQPSAAPASRAEGTGTGLSQPLVFSSTRKAAATVPPKVEHHEDNHGAPTFGGRMFSEEDADAESVEALPRRFPAVAVIAAGLILGAVGGGWYWWHNRAPGVATSAPRPMNPPAPVTAPPSANTQTIPATSSPAPAQGSSKPVEASGHPSAPAPGQPQPVNASLISHEESKPVEKPLGSGEPANKAEKKPALASFRMSAPSALRPPSSSRNLEPAPSIDSAPAVPGAASPEGIGLVGSAGLQPAAPKPEPPAGGELKPARLTSSAPPVYPPLARSQRVEGDVTVDALIDATGRVTTIKVISGPVLLQQSAVSAVHLWKYEPATLNGNAVPMHLVVTVKFRLR